MNDLFHRVRRICSALRHEAEVPVPPPDLPSGRVLYLPGRARSSSASTTDRPTRSPSSCSTAGRHRRTPLGSPPTPPWPPTTPCWPSTTRVTGRGIRAESPFRLEECADDAAAVLELLGVKQAVVAGYSMGGAISLLLQRRHPELVAGLVLAGTALEWRSSPRERLIWQSITFIDMALRVGGGDGFVQRYLREAMVEAPEVAEVRAWVAGELKRGLPRHRRRRPGPGRLRRPTPGLLHRRPLRHHRHHP